MNRLLLAIGIAVLIILATTIIGWFVVSNPAIIWGALVFSMFGLLVTFVYYALGD